MTFSRYAIYFAPPEGALADFGASWLGWDLARGAACPQIDVEGIAETTQTPRKYGFHATLKPPFRLAENATPKALEAAVAALARDTAPARADSLQLAALGRFLALVPQGDTAGIARVAGACVTELDSFRAPPGEAELARRRAAGLSPGQEAMLAQWGYPYVLDEFRFHMTLTGRLPRAQITPWQEVLHHHLPVLEQPFILDNIALVGEREDGSFALIKRYFLGV